ncbi:MAG TPA: DUF4296 domain-containing protein [Flavobacteriales bacterium]|nr:DUF4296 domain-containing protein [Flavobacteriales bacterium]
MRSLVIIVLLAVSCRAPEEAVPSDVLPRDRFKDILVEAQLIEARTNHELVVAHHSSIPSEQYYTDMFKEQGTTKEEFQRSFTFWSGRSADMKVIYEEVLVEISRRKDDQGQ